MEVAEAQGGIIVPMCFEGLYSVLLSHRVHALRLLFLAVLKKAEEAQRAEFVTAASGRTPVKPARSGLGLFHGHRRKSSADIDSSHSTLETVGSLEARSSKTSTSLDKDKRAPVVIFKYIRVGEVLIFGSFKGQRVLEDIEGITLKVHAITVNRKTCTVKQLLIKIRNDVIFDVLSQVRPSCCRWL